MHASKISWFVVLVVAPPALVAACGGAVDGARADAGTSAVPTGATSASRDDADAAVRSLPGDDAAAEGVSDDAGAFDANACGPVEPGLKGAASCGANSATMPIACTGGVPCDTWCKEQNPYARCATSGAWAPVPPVEPGMFLCYTCNP